MFWNEDDFFMPVVYSTVLGQSINVPGYRDGTANLTRPIIPRCLECHAAYFKALEPLPSGSRYDKTSLSSVSAVKDSTVRGRREHIARYG